MVKENPFETTWDIAPTTDKFQVVVHGGGDVNGSVGVDVWYAAVVAFALTSGVAKTVEQQQKSRYRYDTQSSWR